MSESFCEICEKRLQAGDLICFDLDGYLFCEDCAPTLADTLAEWREVAGSAATRDFLGMTKDQVADHIEAVSAKITQFGADAKNVRPYTTATH